MKSVILALTFLIVALACFAQPRWYNTYDSMQSSDDIRSTVIALDGAESFLVTGGNIGRVDINGDWVWQKKIAGSGRIYDGLQLEDGTIVLTGYAGVNGDNGNVNALLVYAMSPDGVELWSSGYSILDKYISGLCVAVESDSTLLIGGYIADDAPGTANLQGMITRMNHQGDLISSVFIEEAMAIQDIECLVEGGGIGVGCLGQSQASDLSSGEYSYFGFGADLQTTWWKRVLGIEGSAIAIAPFGDGFAIAVTIDNDLVMLEIDVDGAIDENSVISSEDPLFAIELAPTVTGKFLLAAEKVHESTTGGVNFIQPLAISMTNMSEFDVSYDLSDGSEDNRLTIGIDGMIDGSMLVGAREGNSMGLYKIFLLEPLPGCSLGQAILTVDDSPLSPLDVITLANSITMTPEIESVPSFNSFSSDLTVNCGGEYCDLEIQILSPAPTQCSGSVFEFSTSAENLTEYSWSFDGMEVETADTLAIEVNDWGFFEVQLDALDVNYCQGSDVVSITSLISPTPILNETDSVALCVGETIQLFTLEEYDFYQWSTASIQQTVTIGIAGEYYVTVTGENGCQATSETTEVFVGDYPTPTVELDGENPFCADAIVTLSTQEFNEYEWTFGQDAQSFETSMPGPYYVIATSDLGCIGYSDTLWLDTLAVPTPFIMADGPLTWCASDGETVGLGANDIYDNIIWSNNVNDSSITVSNSGTYSYQATSFEGCSAFSDTIDVVVWVDPIITIDNITMTAGDACDGSFDLSVEVETVEYNVVWTDLAAETGLFLSDLCYGNYEITVTDENGCSSSENLFVDTSIGIDEIQVLEVLGHPNPVLDVVVFRSENDFEDFVMIDSQGALVRGLEMISNSIDCLSLAQGVYHVQLFDGSTWFQTRIVKL